MTNPKIRYLWIWKQYRLRVASLRAKRKRANQTLRKADRLKK